MNTFLSEELQGLKKQYELFAKEHLKPVAEDLACQQATLPEFLKLVAQSGYLAITVPKEYGGQGGTFLDLILFAEAMAFYEPGFVLSLAGHTVVIELLKQFGTDAQKSRYLPLLVTGECLGAFAYVENDACDTLAGVATTVKSLSDQKNMDGQSSGKVLAGKKQAVINGRLADLFVVLAVEPDQEKVKADGTSAPPGALWLVDRGRQGQPGNFKIASRQKGTAIGLHSASIDEVQFEDCLLSEEDRLGSDPRPSTDDAQTICQSQIDFAQNISKTILAAAAVGLTEGALFRSANYARSEKRSGVALSSSQAVQWKIADLAVESSAARLLTYRAAWSKDEDSAEFSKYAAMCKSFAAKAARLHSAEALQILGANADSSYSESYSESYSDLIRFFTDAKMLEMIEGNSEEQKSKLANELSV